MKDFDLQIGNFSGGPGAVTVGPRALVIRTKLVDLDESLLWTRVNQPPILNGSRDLTHDKPSHPPTAQTARPRGSGLKCKNVDLEKPLPSEIARIALRRTVFEIFHFKDQILEFF
jgi:hypothetical protein